MELVQNLPNVMRAAYCKAIMQNSSIAFLSIEGHIQISQVPDRNEPGTNGELNYTFIFNHLLRIGYSGWIGCEYVPQGKSTLFVFNYCSFVKPNRKSFSRSTTK